jgi:adenine specific DNA methylase Mod
MLKSIKSFLGNNDMMAYLTMMAARLLELHRVLKETGSIYLHCDPTASHYLKVLLDAIFRPEHFQAEIIWRRTNARGTKGRWPWLHDVILHYAKTDNCLLPD